MLPLRDDNPTRITPYVTWALVVLNVVLFLVEQLGGLVETDRGLRGGLAGWTMVPYEVTRGADLAINGYTLQPAWLTIFTSMFLHGGWMHLLGNMLFLVIFGNNIEDALGHIKYLIFYLVCGVIAAGTQIVFSPASPIPMLGASGAVAGILGGYLLLYPNARVNTLILWIVITTVQLPAWVLLGFWIASQFFNQFTHALLTGGQETGGVAYLAHIGGFAAGFLLIKLFGAKPNRPGEGRRVVYYVDR